MSEKKRFTIILEATLCSFGLMVFSFFIQYTFPVSILAYGALLLSAFIISRNLRTLSDLKMITGRIRSFKVILLYLLLGITTGAILSVMYRSHLDIHLFPSTFQLFAITAALIGSVEELVFRGFLQELVRPVSGRFSILFSTLSHTGYKCCLFLAPVTAVNTDVGFLAFWTFMAGMVLGALRHLSKSILPSLSAHVLFDIWIYGEYFEAPRWVW